MGLKVEISGTDNLSTLSQYTQRLFPPLLQASYPDLTQDAFTSPLRGLNGEKILLPNQNTLAYVIKDMYQKYQQDFRSTSTNNINLIQ